MPSNVLNTQCVISGGGPAGLMSGLLLARAGVNVIVLEKHKDFLRDFRGDTIHPSTMEVVHELGWLDEFLRLPHYPARSMMSWWDGTEMELGNFSRLPTQAKFIAMMPQWNFLNFLAEKAKAYKTFKLMTLCEAQSLIEDGSKVVGVRAQMPDGALEVHADLVLAADGRGSELRDQSGLDLEVLGAPMDVLWLRISRKPQDSKAIELRFSRSGVLIMINRDDYWQCAVVIQKGQFENVKAAGLAQFRKSIAQLTPLEATRFDEIQSWDQVKLLNVQVNRLRKWWREGFLCIGDAAHAMSPIGGVGVNLAVQDAVAASNILAQPLLQGNLSVSHLAALQERREFPVKVTQKLQVTIQNHIIAAALHGAKRMDPPLPLRIVNSVPFLNRLPGRLIGMGVRPEHVHTQSAFATDSTAGAAARNTLTPSTSST